MSAKTMDDLGNYLLSYIKKKELTESVKKWILTLIQYFSADSDNSNAIPWHNQSECHYDAKHCKILPFSKLPQKKGYPLIGCMLDYYHNLGKTHWLLAQRSRDLGPIFKEKVGSTEIVFLSDLEAVVSMVKSEGRHPYHFDVLPWLEYRKESGKSCGILTAQGEDWGRMRKVINKHLMRSKHVSDMSAELNAVTDDFLCRLSRVRNSDNTISDLHQELLRWALESTGVVLFEKRLGCLEGCLAPDTEAFLKNAEYIMSLTQQLIYLPPSVAKVILHSTWREHTDCWEALFSMAQKCVDEKIADIKENIDREDKMGGFLCYLLGHGSLGLEEIYANVIELMMGGVHTSTAILQWLLYELSHNPDAQQRLHSEISQGIPSTAPVTTAQLDDMPYLKAVLYESLRLYPVSGGIPRIIQTDLTLCGYHIPKGTNIMVLTHVLGRSADLFENPDTFYPARWLQSDLSENQKMVKTLPFGMGSRMCVGKRVAELQLSVLVARISQRFVIEPVTCDPVDIQSCLLLQPDKPIHIRLVDRD